jgi:hypothetical protein
MIKFARSLLMVIFTTLLFSACNLPQTGSQGSGSVPVGTAVAETLAALTQSAQQSPQASGQTPLAPPTLASLTQTPGKLPTTTITPIPKPGSIAGNISGYPYGPVPRLAVVAYGQEPPYNYSYVITDSGSSYYSMSTSYLIPGKWLVVAYDSSGNSGGCPVLVTVISDQTVNCDITDWASSYRSKPSGVPNP